MAQVDIVTRTKDRALFLRRCFNDLQQQTFRDFRWIIVNDGGEAAPVAAIAREAKAAGLNADLIALETSRGMEAAGNAGVRAGSSPLIAIHDDDDTWDPRFLARMTEVLKDGRHAGAASWSLECRERVEAGRIVEESRRKSCYRPDAADIAAMAMRNRFPPIAFLFRRSAYEAAGGFDESLEVLGDWDFNLRMLMQGDIAIVREELACYHIRPAGTEGANSVTAQHARHVETTARLRNKYIRKDMESGRFGAGAMMAFAAMIEDAAVRSSYSERLKRLGRKVFRT